jgi:hypothetical protein
MSAADHGARLSRAEAEIRELRKGQEVIFSKLDSQGAKLDTIAAAVHELRASSGPALRDILSIVTSCAVLFGIVAVGIIYLARCGNSEALHDLDVRLARIETTMRLQPPAHTKRPGPWVPETQ